MLPPMPANKQRSASSVADFLSVVTELRKEWCEEDKKEWKSDDKDFEPSQFWFRGVSRPTYELKPKVYRKSGFDAVRKYPRTEFNENEIRRGFKSCGSQLMTEPHLPEDQKGWYFLMQHYRAPT